MIVDNLLFRQNEDALPRGGNDLFQRAFEQLTDKERVKGLAQSRRDAQGAKNNQNRKVHVVEDVIRTNAFGITIAGRDAKGLYPEVARMNHGCDPK